MKRRAHVAVPAILLVGLACPSPEEESGERVEIEANTLQQAFLADERAARDRFDGADLVIYGEVAGALPRVRGTTMRGEVTLPSHVAFLTALDTLPTDTKYVQVEGQFDVPDTLAPWTLDPRIRIGDSLRVSCPRARIRWTDPGLYVSDCRIAN